MLRVSLPSPLIFAPNALALLPFYHSAHSVPSTVQKSPPRKKKFSPFLSPVSFFAPPPHCRKKRGKRAFFLSFMGRPISPATSSLGPISSLSLSSPPPPPPNWSLLSYPPSSPPPLLLHPDSGAHTLSQESEGKERGRKRGKKRESRPPLPSSSSLFYPFCPPFHMIL